MPELPEVETVCRQLEPELEGRRIESLEVLDAALVPARAAGRAGSGGGGDGRSRGWAGAASTCCSGSDGGQTLVMHLRMTGNLVLVEGEDKLDPSEGMRLYEGERSTSERHLRARFVLDDGRELWFTDPRRFGEALLLDDAGARRALRARLGIEPLSAEFTPEALGEIAAGRTVAAQVLPARPEGRRRGRQHLRRRGALPGAAAPALAGRLDEARAPRGAARRGRRRPGSRDRRRRRLDRRLPRRARREGARCRTSSSSTPARASPARAATGRSSGSSSPAARPTSARPARCGCAAARAAAAVRLVVHLRRLMAGKTLKTEAIVLRSIRYGEADRILHLYTAQRGRVGAIAKGARRPKSRFGGRLEPFFRLDLLLHEGRGELLTVTQAATVDGYPRLRASGAALTAGRPRLRRGAAAARLGRAQPARLQPALPLPGAARRPRGARRRRRCRRRSPSASSSRSPPASRPSSAPARAAARREHLVGFSGAAGGVVCASCEAGSFPLSEEAHRFMVDSIARPLAEAPEAGERRAAPGRAGDRRDAGAPRARAAASPRRRIGGRGGHGDFRGPRASLGGRVPLRPGDALLPRRSARSRRPTARCAPRFSATATGSSTRRPSAASSTRRRSSSRPKATTTAPASPTPSRPAGSPARSPARSASTRT